MKAILTFLSYSEIEQIHGASLRILQETGIKVTSEKVKKLLAENGAEIGGDIVKFPKSVIEEAIRRAPQEITLEARDPKCGLKIPTDEFTLNALSGFAPFVDDFETGERRYATSSDLKDFAIVGDYLDTVDIFWPIVVPSDYPPAIQELHSLLISLRNNRKHITCSCTTEKMAQWHIRLTAAIVGGEAELRKRPIFSALISPITPLTFEKDASEAIVVLAKSGIPIVPMNMVLGGTSAPATIAGILALANAEQLACLAIVQYACPGAPMVYCSEPATANMRTGGIDYSAPQYPLLCAGGAQMARFYKLPNYVADIAPGDKIPGSIAPEHKSAKTIRDMQYDIVSDALLFMNNTDMVANFGSVDEAISASLSKVVLDAEAFEHVRAYQRRFEINDDTLALDIINKVGHGGHFLEMDHTLKHYKKEIWNKKLPQTFVLDPATEGSFTERAQAKVKEILATHKPPLIEEAVEDEIRMIIPAAEKDIMGK